MRAILRHLASGSVVARAVAAKLRPRPRKVRETSAVAASAVRCLTSARGSVAAESASGSTVIRQGSPVGVVGDSDSSGSSTMVSIGDDAIGASAASLAVSREVEHLLRPEGSRRCLWVLGSREDSSAPLDAVTSIRRVLQRAAVSREVFFDFEEYRYRNFDVLIEALQVILGGAASKALAHAVLADNTQQALVMAAVVERHENLARDLLTFAEELAEGHDEADVAVSAARRAARRAAEAALSAHDKRPELLWQRLAAFAAGGFDHVTGSILSSDAVDAYQWSSGAVHVLQGAAAVAERNESPAGYLDRRTGRRQVPYNVGLLEAAATAAKIPVAAALLNVQVLRRSLFLDDRGSELLDTLLDRMQLANLRSDAESPSPFGLRTVFHTDDGLTACHGLSPLRAPRVVVLPSRTNQSAAAVGSASYDDTVGVIVAADLGDDRHGADGCIDGSGATVSTAANGNTREQAIFEWQMNEALGHPAMLELRQVHTHSSTSFAVILWETIRLLCRRPHLPAPKRVADIEHPIVQALLHANILVPRWGPTRLVLAGSRTRLRLLQWIDAQHAKLTWTQRIEYNVQLFRERPNLLRDVKRAAACG